MDFEDSSESSSQTEVHGYTYIHTSLRTVFLPIFCRISYDCLTFLGSWTINTKYYTADVAVWISHICDDYSLPTFPQSHPLVALVMVFDLSEVCH